jgi:hypothetical protein
MTLEIALASIIASLDLQTGSDTAALEALGEISAQVLFLVLGSLILSVALSGGCMTAFRSLSSDGLISPYQALLAGLKKFFPTALGKYFAFLCIWARFFNVNFARFLFIWSSWIISFICYV